MRPFLETAGDEPEIAEVAIATMQKYASTPAGLCGVLGLLGLNTREGWIYDVSDAHRERFVVHDYVIDTAPCERVLVVVLPSGPATKEEGTA